MRYMRWIKIVLVPLAVLAVVLGVIFKLFNVVLLGIPPSGYLKMADTIFLFVIVIVVFRIDRKSEII